jgi:hypothetical protein
MVLPDQGRRTTASVTITVGTGASAQTITAAHPRIVSATAGIPALITPAEAQRLNASIVSAGSIVTNPTPFNESQRASIDALAPSIMFGVNGEPRPDDITELLWSTAAERDLARHRAPNHPCDRRRHFAHCPRHVAGVVGRRNA